MNAIADMVMQEMNGGSENNAEDDLVNTSQQSLNMSMKRKIGEDLIVDKINQIFDEV